MEGKAYPDKPWDHPDWYDLHDREWTAGQEREPEHYHEFLIALPPLDRDDHLVDIGAGTGKLAAIIAGAYSRLGLLTLVEPNEEKLLRAKAKCTDLLSEERVKVLSSKAGTGSSLSLARPATLAITGSVIMPLLEDWAGSPESALKWVRQTLRDILGLLAPGSWFYALETTARFWVGAATGGVRRLTLLEFQAELNRAGLSSVECVYRFRDRVIVRGQRNN